MKNRIHIIATGRTRCREEWDLGLLDLALLAGGEALDNSSVKPTAVITANALGDMLGDQRNLALHTASRLGLKDVETLCVSCDEASGGAAIRQGILMIEAGVHETVLVIGAEKTSDALPDQLEAARATGLDAAREASFGFSPAIASALGMSRYLAVHEQAPDAFYHLSRIAHAHGAHNRLGFFPWPLSLSQYQKSPVVATPLTVCDNAPAADGAAAVMLHRQNTVAEGVRLLASASASAAHGIAEAIDTLALPSAVQSGRQALLMANLALKDISFFELHDASAFLAALSIEATGLTERGCALTAAREDQFLVSGETPLWTFGGHKSRGNAPGAGGVYQMVEACLTLEGKTNNPLPTAQTAFVQCLGSFGAQAITHILTVR